VSITVYVYSWIPAGLSTPPGGRTAAFAFVMLRYATMARGTSVMDTRMVARWYWKCFLSDVDR